MNELQVIKPFINQGRFVKAVEYVSEHLFSKPFSITHSIDRWFNQQARVELTNGEILGLSDDTYIDITLDGELVSPDDIHLVQKFKSPTTTYEFDKERAKLIAEIAKILEEQKLKVAPAGITRKEKAAITQSIEDLKKDAECLFKKLGQLDAERMKADQLYKDIVARGTSSINEKRIEKKEGCKIKNIIYRPNHDLNHSARAVQWHLMVNQLLVKVRIKHQ